MSNAQIMVNIPIANGTDGETGDISCRNDNRNDKFITHLRRLYPCVVDITIKYYPMNSNAF